MGGFPNYRQMNEYLPQGWSRYMVQYAYSLPAPEPISSGYHIRGYSGNERKDPGSSMLERSLNQDAPGDSTDFMAQQETLKKDRVSMVLDLIQQQEQVTYQNLQSLYNDLFTVDRMMKDRPFPDCYKRDQIWLKMAEDKLKLYEQIRSERQNKSKAFSFIAKDLISAVLDYKEQKSLSSLMGGLDSYTSWSGEQ